MVAVFGAAHPYDAYVFANRRGDPLKVRVLDRIDIWLCARRLQQGGFVRAPLNNTALTQSQFDALVPGLQRARAPLRGGRCPGAAPNRLDHSNWDGNARSRIATTSTPRGNAPYW